MAATMFALQDPADEASLVNAAVAAEVRAAMGRLRVTQTKLAKALNISQGSMSRRLSGEVPFDVVELARIAKLLGTSVSELTVRAIVRWCSDSADVTSVNTALDDPFQLLLDFDAEERRADIRNRTRELVTS